jgi:PIN domain nuclease of toxin-antitoxin system
MRYLLDTHASVWLDGSPQSLFVQAQTLLTDPRSELLLSVSSIWEVAIKSQLGKLALTAPLAAVVQQQTVRNRLQLLPVRLEHILTVETLPLQHRDPFDRSLVAQAIVENAVIVSRDAILDVYPITRCW